MSALTYGHLPVEVNPGVHIACGNPDCDQYQAHYSACRRDYWMMIDQDPITCESCDGAMRVVRVVTMTYFDA